MSTSKVLLYTPDPQRTPVRRALAIAITASLMLGSGVVMAQEADAPAEEENAMLGEVLVTAQKRAERQLDVPMSISVVGGSKLAVSGVVATGDLQQVIPGLTTVNNGLGFVPVIRGISSQGTSPGDESNVSIYVDDVYIGAPMAGLFDLADVERVEVLKGPQGTLFGRNATGGAIRVVTRLPSFLPQGSFSVDYGFKYNEWKSSAYLTGGITDTLAGSISATLRQGDGYIEGIGPNEGRNFGKPDNYLVRGKLLYQPSDTWTFQLSLDALETDNDHVAAVWPPAGVNPFPGSTPSQPYRYAGSTEPKQLVDGTSAALDVTWEGSEFFTLRSITAYRELDLDYQSDIDRTDLSSVALHLTQYQDSFSQELNISSVEGSQNDWVAGFYYYDSDAGNPFWSVIGGDSPNGNPISSFRSRVETSSYAVFADYTWNASEQLHLTLGARYTSESKDFSYHRLVGAPLDVVRDEDWSSPTYRAVVRYDLGTDSNVYASLSNGFKSGVYDAYSPLGVPVDPEEVDALEVGWKSRINGITYTAAAFAYEYDDIQVSSFATVGDVVVLSLTNAASARMRGFEFTAEGNLSESLYFSTGLSWIPTAEFSDFTTAQVTIPTPGATGPVIGEVIAPFDASGSRIPRTPKWTANLQLTHFAEVWGGQLESTVTAFHSPGFYWQAGNFTEEPSYSTVGMRIGWTDAADRVTYSIWGNNLTDSDHSLYTVPNVRGNSSTGVQGRQFGVGLALRF